MKRKESTGRAPAGRRNRGAEAELIQLHQIGFQPLAESCVFLLHRLLRFSYAAIGQLFLSVPLRQLAVLIRSKLGELPSFSEACLEEYMRPLFLRLEGPRAAGSHCARPPPLIGQCTLAEMLGPGRTGLRRAVRRIQARLQALAFAWASPPVIQVALQAHSDDILHFILVRVRFDWHTAQDLTQETLIAARRALPKYKPTRAQLFTFLKGIARQVLKGYFTRLYRKQAIWVPLDPMNPTPGASAELWLAPRDLILGQAILIDIYRRLLDLLFSGEKPAWQVIAFVNSRILHLTPGEMLKRYGVLPLRRVVWLTAREFAGQYEFLCGVIPVEFKKLHRQMNLPISHFDAGASVRERFGSWLGGRVGDHAFNLYFPAGKGGKSGHTISNAVVSVSKWLLAKIQGSAFWKKLLDELDP